MISYVYLCYFFSFFVAAHQLGVEAGKAEHRSSQVDLDRQSVAADIHHGRGILSTGVSRVVE
jgi:hypothetical protein